MYRDVDNIACKMPLLNVNTDIMTLLTLHVRNYTVLLIALGLQFPLFEILSYHQYISPGGRKIAPVSPYFPSSWTDNNTYHDTATENIRGSKAGGWPAYGRY